MTNKTDHKKQSASSDQPQIIKLDIDVGKPLRPSVTKLTRTKRRRFLEYLATDGFNITRAAAKVGVSRNTIFSAMKRDAQFKAAYDYVVDAYLDKVEETTIQVAVSPSRDGFNDRKLLLQARRPETYGQKLQIDQRSEVKVEISLSELDRILVGQNVKSVETGNRQIPETIDFTEVSED
jgi:hypothetical protein